MWLQRAAVGLVVGSGYALGEGLGVALLARAGGATSIGLALGVLAPVVLLVGVLWAVGGWGLQRWFGASVGPRIGAWATQGDAEQRASRTAWTLAALVGISAWAGAALIVGPPVMDAIVTPLFAAAAIVIALLIAAAMIVPLVPAIAALFERPLRIVSSRRVVCPAGIVALLTAGAVLAVAVGWIALPETMILLPWTFALGSAGAVVGFVLATLRPKLLKPKLLAGLLALLAVVSFFAPRSLAGEFAAVRDTVSVAGAGLGAANALLDFDGDESVSFYGGLDCAPFDSSIGPNQVEVVSNGIDEDCSGQDLVVDMSVDEPLPRGPKPAKLKKKPHIFMVTADALTHTQTTFGGYDRDTTPGLAKLAERATVFDHAFSLSASTRTALPGLLSGTFNSQVRMKKGRRHPFRWAKDWPTVATTLKKAGYETRHVFSDKYFRTKWYSRGYSTIVDGSVLSEDKKHTGVAVADAAIEQIEARGDKPLHMWVHFYDAHHPYQQPAGVPVFGKRKVDRYDAELVHLDKQWTRVFDHIEKTFKPDEYILIVSSDHGEAFDDNHLVGEHHTGSVLTPVTHVPLIIQSSIGRGKRLDDLVTHADVLPTIAHLIDAPVRDEWIGSSLLGVMNGEPFPRDRVYSLRYEPRRRKNRSGFLDVGVRTADRHLMLDVRAGTAVMVDWKNDLLERNDLSQSEPDTYAQLRYLAAKRLEWLRENENGLPRK